jgi:hypothetical protein
MGRWIPGFIEIIETVKNPSPNDAVINILKKLQPDNVIQLQSEIFIKNKNNGGSLLRSCPSNYGCPMFQIYDNESYLVTKKQQITSEHFEIVVVPIERKNFDHFGKIIDVEDPRCLVPEHTIISDGTIRENESGHIVSIIKNVIVKENEH